MLVIFGYQDLTTAHSRPIRSKPRPASGPLAQKGRRRKAARSGHPRHQPGRKRMTARTTASNPSMSRQPGRKCGDRQTSRRKLPGFCLPEHGQGGDPKKTHFLSYSQPMPTPPSEDKLANKKPADMSQAGLGAKCLLMKTDAASYFLATPPMRDILVPQSGQVPLVITRPFLVTPS